VRRRSRIVRAPRLASLAFIRRAENPSVAGDTPAEGETAGGVLGDFRILCEVGNGGMGVVYEAEQISLQRRVALKVLPFAATMDTRHLQRFHNEARAAAGLHHPNIVPVYFVGCERSVRIYAMQFIEGQTLAELIAVQRHDLASGGVIAPLADRSDAADCRGDYAGGSARCGALSPHCRMGHPGGGSPGACPSLGIVHRDIKPSNLMIDAAGKLWVTDFGLAHCQNQVGLTMTRDLMGTIRYMSQEQALAQRGSWTTAPTPTPSARRCTNC
jgi:serine/threonine protein kinase